MGYSLLEFVVFQIIFGKPSKRTLEKFGILSQPVFFAFFIRKCCLQMQFYFTFSITLIDSSKANLVLKKMIKKLGLTDPRPLLGLNPKFFFFFLFFQILTWAPVCQETLCLFYHQSVLIRYLYNYAYYSVSFKL